MSLNSPHIMILTGEPSGDFHAGPLIREIKRLVPGARISGIGGDAMAAQGAEIFFPIDRLSAMGLIQVARQFSSIKQAFSLFRQRVKTDRPDLVIFIDYPGFNLKAAAWLKSRHDIPSLYYIAPKVWAWNAARLNRIKACMDHVALILPFEPLIYRKKGIPATYVGNPLVDEYPPYLTQGSENPEEPAETPPTLVIGLLPGSRTSEVESLMPELLDAAALVLKKYPGAEFHISAASRKRKEQIESFLNRHPVRAHCRIVDGRPLAIFRTARMVIAASGTVTLEAALCRIPTIIVYKVSALTYALGKLLVKVKYAGLANLIAGEEVMPELSQQDASAPRIFTEALQMLDTIEAHERKLDQVRLRLGGPGAPRRTARIALGLIRNTP